MAYQNEKAPPSRDLAESLFLQAMDHMDGTINAFLNQLCEAEKKERGEVIANGFVRKDRAIAVVLKLVQFTSDLRAGKLLIDHGHIYELGTTIRVVVETIEDVLFLLAQHHADRDDDVHPRYLEAFYAEGSDRVQYPRRHEIRGFLKGLENTKPDDPTAWENTIGNLYRLHSQYVHGRAVRIRELYESGTGQFRTSGIDDEEELTRHRKGLWLASFVVMDCFAAAGAAFWQQDWKSDIWQFAERFYKAAGLGAKSQPA